MTLAIDHISYASSDLDAAREYFRVSYGLDAVEGGSHPQWGTANLIVPLGRHFLEIFGVVDPEVAATSAVGTATAARAAEGDRPFGLCLRVDDIAGEAERLGLPLLAGERRYGDGRVLRWKELGVSEALGTLGLPYFFAYDDDKLRLGARPPRHSVQPLGIVGATVAIDALGFREYVAGEELPVTFVEGNDGLRSVTVALADGGTLEIGPRTATLEGEGRA